MKDFIAREKIWFWRSKIAKQTVSTKFLRDPIARRKFWSDYQLIISSLGLLCLTTLTKLEALKIRNCTLIDSDGWHLTDRLPHLTSFTSRPVNDTFFAKLVNSCPNLEYLHLAGSAVKNISELSKLTNLHYLNLSATKITELTVLQKLTRLKELNLADIPSARNMSDILTNLTNLVSLNIANNAQLSNATVGTLTKLNNLEYLNIEGAVLIDIAVLPYLDRFVHLKHLRRNGTKLPSSTEVRYFVKNGLMYK